MHPPSPLFRTRSQAPAANVRLRAIDRQAKIATTPTAACDPCQTFVSREKSSYMNEPLRRYLITAYTEWETLDVEARCPDDERAVAKARRYASLKYMTRNLPAAIFGHVVCDDSDELRVVGTWEYRLKGDPNSYLEWHPGFWQERPLPEDCAALRKWSE